MLAKIKKYKIFIIIGVVAVIGGLAAWGIVIHRNNTREVAYTCTFNVEDREKSVFDISYKGKNPVMVSLTTTITGPKAKNEDGTKNTSQERTEYEAYAEMLTLTYGPIENLQGFSVDLKNDEDEDGATAMAKIIVDYSKNPDTSVSSMFPQKGKKVEEYLKILTDVGYKCEKK